jgi:cytochrome c-type biogenesis protein CcmH
MKLFITLGLMLVMATVLVLVPLFTKDAKGDNPRVGVFLAVLIMAVAGGAYFYTGSPDVVDSPAFLEALDQTDDNTDLALPSVEEMINTLKAGVVENPTDIEAWSKLANAMMSLGRYGEAVTTYSEALQLAPDLAWLHSAYGEALTLLNDGFITEEAFRAFETALLLDQNEQISRFYMADYAFQQGNVETAYAQWLSLYGDVSVEIPWLQLLDQRIRQAASNLGLEPPQILSEKQYLSPDVFSEDLQEMSVVDQVAMIESMVAGLAARLEENPGDLAGWERLGRSYMVLGRHEEAVRAFGMIAGARPNDAAALGQYIQALMTWLEATGQHVTDQALVALQKLITLDPENALALYYLGQAAAERDDPAGARLYWQRLLAMMPEESDGAKLIQEKLAALD